MVKVYIRCKDCGEGFKSFREYRRHLLTVHPKDDMDNFLALEDHDAIVDFLARNPWFLGKRMRLVAKELHVLRGRIDLVLRDGEGNLCLVDVTRGKDLKRKKEQLRRYREYVRRLGSRLYGVQVKRSIRLFIIQPGKQPLEVTGYG